MNEIEQPKYTIIDLVAADEQEAYSMVFEDELCPNCKSMPNNPRRSNDGLFGICAGTNFMFTISTITQLEAEELMKTVNWFSYESLEAYQAALTAYQESLIV